MVNSNKKTHQHTVPACYLANFGICGNEGRESMLYFYNVNENKTDTTKVGKLPVENYFYDIPELGEHKQIIENMFCNIEGEFAALLRILFEKIIIDPKYRDCSSVQLNGDEKEQLSAQFAFLMTRTRAYRDFYKYIYQKVKEAFPYANLPQYSKSDFQRIHTSDIIGFRMSNFYANLFNDWNWIFLINHTDISFFTSDNPVIRINHIKNDYEPKSAASPEITYFFPISPTIAVEIIHKDILKTDLLYFDIQQSSIAHAYNKEVIKSCSRFLFSNQSFEALKNARSVFDDQT